MREIGELLAVMARLRDPQAGCPWDLAQTYASIVPHTVEEAYEVADAIERGNLDDLRDELGDLLFQVVFYAHIASEEGHFDFRDVAERISRKMIRRHPHVFADVRYADLDEQTLAWEAIKAQEKEEDGQAPHKALAGVPRALPAMTRALKLQRKASREGFDWTEPGPVVDKVEEELGELRRELVQHGSRQRVSEEIGDLFFACVNLARHLDVDPEQSLRGANQKFQRRFEHIEASLAAQGKRVRELAPTELDALWEVAKVETDTANP